MAKGKRQKPTRPQRLPAAQIDFAQQVVGIIRQEYSGPLPPPNALKTYNEIIPNGADRIMKMAEEQSKHRRALETKALNTDSRNSLLGILSALLLGFVTIIGGGYVIIKGYSVPGTLLGSAGLIGLVSVFIYGTKQRRAERQAKSQLH